MRIAYVISVILLLFSAFMPFTFNSTHAQTATSQSPTTSGISLSVSSLIISQGSSGAFVVSVLSPPFISPVTFSTLALPSGMTVTFTPSTLTFSSSGTWTTAGTVTVGSSTPTGVYTVTITASGQVKGEAAMNVIVEGSYGGSYYGPYVQGCVYANQYNGKPISWADLIVSSPLTGYNFVFSTGPDGCYLFYLPAGQYNMTVIEPGYIKKTFTFNVPSGGTTLNIFLTQSPLPCGSNCQSTSATTSSTTSMSSSTSTTSSMTTTGTSTIPVSGMHVTLQLSTTDANGNPTYGSVFNSGSTVLVQAIVLNDGSVPLNNAYLLVSVYDSNNMPIFTGVSVTSLNVGQSTKISMGPTLPATAPTGTYVAQVIVLTAFLSNGGALIPGGSGAVTFTVK